VLWAFPARLSGTYLAMSRKQKPLTAAFLLVRGLSVLVGDTGFEPVTSSVSVISDTPDNGAVAVSMVRGCPQMIAGCRID
jgi:hypothetical protein